MKKELFLGIALLAAIFLGCLWQFYPLPNAKARLAKLPMNGENFKGKKVPLVDWEKQVFGKVNLLKRVYEVDGELFFLTAIDGTNNRNVVHDPLYCFKGGGWDIVSRKPFKLGAKGEGMLVHIQKGLQQRDALVWFSDDQLRFYSVYEYWLQTMLRRLTLGRSGSEPVLIMIQPLEARPLDYNKIFKQFPELLNL